MNNETEGKCPVMHGSLTSNSSSGTSNKDWWPNQLNLNILHQHDAKSDPMDMGFDYREGIVGLHIHGESTLVLGLILAMLIVMPMYFSKKLLLIKKEK